MIPGVNQPLTRSSGGIIAFEAVIASGASESQVLDLDGGERQITGVQMPAAWTAASLTLLASWDGTTFVPLHWSGAEFVVEAAGGAAASLAFSVDPAVTAGWRFVKLRSGVTGAAVNQAAERTLMVLTRPV